MGSGNGICDPRSAIRDPGSETQDPGSETRDPKPGIRDPGSETRDQRPGIRDPGSEPGVPRPGIRDEQKSRSGKNIPDPQHCLNPNKWIVERSKYLPFLTSSSSSNSSSIFVILWNIWSWKRHNSTVKRVILSFFASKSIFFSRKCLKATLNCFSGIILYFMGALVMACLFLAYV